MGMLELIHWLYWNSINVKEPQEAYARTYTLVVLKSKYAGKELETRELELIHWLYWNKGMRNISVDCADTRTYTLVVLKFYVWSWWFLDWISRTYTLVVLKLTFPNNPFTYGDSNLYIGCIEIT